MAKLSIVQGTTSKSVGIFVQDATSSTGQGLAGLLYNTANLVAYYFQPGVTGATSITLATLASTTASFSSGGFKEIDSTNMKGCYRFDIPNAALTGATSVVVMLSGAANMVPVVLECELTAWNNQDATRGGMTAMPNANAGASGGLIINGSNSGTATLAALTVSGATTLTGNVSMAAGLTVTQSSSNTPGIAVTGNGTAQGVRVTGGATGAALGLVGGSTSGAGLTVTTTSGDGVSVTPTAGNGLTVTANGASKHGAVITGGTSGTSDGFKAVAGSGGVDIRGNITGSITGDVSGNLGGNVGGNVTGSTGTIANAPTNFNLLNIDSSGNVYTKTQVKKNTAISYFVFKVVLSSDHLTGATGKTVSCTRSINGAALAATATATATEISNGFYYVPLATTDVNGDTILFRATAAACDPTEITIYTQP